MASSSSSSTAHKPTFVRLGNSRFGLSTTPIKLSKAYQTFKSTVPRRQVGTPDGQNWWFYDHGPKDVEPLVCLHGTSGTEDVFFNQILWLAAKGYRVISVRCPPVWTHDQFCHSFDAFLEALSIDRCHLYGVSLGGLLLQNYASLYPQRIASLGLTNTFCDTTRFEAGRTWLRLLSLMPDFYLRQFVLRNFPQQAMEVSCADATDFMVERLESLSRRELASRLTLNRLRIQASEIRVRLPRERVTLIDCTDDVTLPPDMRQQMYNKYKGARQAFLKSGGDFPFISHPEEVNLYLQVHLRANGLQPKPISPEKRPSGMWGGQRYYTDSDDEEEDDDDDDDVDASGRRCVCGSGGGGAGGGGGGAGGGRGGKAKQASGQETEEDRGAERGAHERTGDETHTAHVGEGRRHHADREHHHAEKPWHAHCGNGRAGGDRGGEGVLRASATSPLTRDDARCIVDMRGDGGGRGKGYGCVNGDGDDSQRNNYSRSQAVEGLDGSGGGTGVGSDSLDVMEGGAGEVAL